MKGEKYMFAVEDYKEIRESVKFGVAWALQTKHGSSVSIHDIFDMIFDFINEFSLFPESTHKLRSYIQSNNILLNERRQKLYHIIFERQNSIEEMIDEAIDYSLCIIIYDGFPKDIKKFRELHHV